MIEIEKKYPDYAENYREEWIKFVYVLWSEKWKTWKIMSWMRKDFWV